MEPEATQIRPSRNPVARALAVLALVAAAIVLVVVISGSIGGSSGNSGSGAKASRASHNKPKHKYYVVEPGDTFGGIAEKQGVPIARLEKLNPNLDTQLLPQKGCVNLVPEGCKVLAKGG
jgi:LysM domain